MILKASTRGRPMGLARHLFNEKDNDHIELHSIRGFVSDDLTGAMREVHAMSATVKSKQPLFSVSLSPPAHELAEVDLFEQAAAQVLERNGLQDQPHALIFHEKDGRRHAHLVVSRIDTEHGRVIPLPYFKQKLFDLSKEIYLDRGWDLPAGFIDKRDRDPRNYDLETYHKAKREGLDPKHLKMMAQEAWSITKGKDQVSFAKELEKRGLYLAKGDRRGHVAVTWRGEVHALPRLLGCKTKDVRERLGEPKNLRSVDDTRDHIRTVLEPVMGRMIDEADRNKAAKMIPLEQERTSLNAQHRAERAKLDTGQKARQEAEAKERAAQLRKGFAGLWDRVSGRYRQIRDRHIREAYTALQRDREQRQAIIAAQLAERQELQRRMNAVRQQHAERLAELHRELQRLRDPQQQGKKAGRSASPKAKEQRDHSQAGEDKAVSARQAWIEQQRQRDPKADHRDKENTRTSRAEWLRQRQDRSRQDSKRDRDAGYDREI